MSQGYMDNNRVPNTFPCEPQTGAQSDLQQTISSWGVKSKEMNQCILTFCPKHHTYRVFIGSLGGMSKDTLNSKIITDWST